MLTLRPEQMRAFNTAALDDFERRALIYLARSYPDFALRHGEGALRTLLKECRAQADAANLGSELGIVTWTELVICYGDDFQSQEPWAGYILALDVDMQERVERLREYV
jgi:hypothetical protein